MTQPTPQKHRKISRQGLNYFKELRNAVIWIRRFWLVKVWGMDIHPDTMISLSAKLDKTFPKGVHVARGARLAFEVRIMTHDRTRGLYLHTRIGEDAFIGGRSIILPGVEIGAGSMVAVGSVVTKSVPPRTLVGGNPAKILREGITIVGGRFLEADANESALVEAGLT
ncbi:acyltransferase [Fuscibacter oryzae]|nr:acyltransferase [Fuscibacter oryzae]